MTENEAWENIVQDTFDSGREDNECVFEEICFLPPREMHAHR